MPYHIKDAETDRMIRDLARLKGKPIVECIREACAHEIERERARVSLWERLQPLLDKVAAAPKTGLAADKAFFDDLSGDA
jgi:antitoxin VapB